MLMRPYCLLSQIILRVHSLRNYLKDKLNCFFMRTDSFIFLNIFSIESLGKLVVMELKEILVLRLHTLLPGKFILIILCWN